MHCRHFLTIALCHPERLSTIQFDKFLWQFWPLYLGYSKLFLCSQHLRMRIFQHNFVVSFSTVFGKFTNHCSIRELRLEGQQTVVSLWTICSLTTAHKLVHELCITLFLLCTIALVIATLVVAVLVQVNTPCAHAHQHTHTHTHTHCQYRSHYMHDIQTCMNIYYWVTKLGDNWWSSGSPHR